MANTGYEIPEELEYEREWIAGLTFKQIGIISASITIGMMAFILPIGTPTQAAIFTMIAGGGTVITMAELDGDIVDILRYASRWNVSGYLDQHAYEFMNIEDIKNQKIIQKDQYQSAIIRVDPINFEVKSEEERTSILANYKKFLQSIEHPIHIIVRTVDSLENIEEYFDYNRKQVQEYADKNNQPELKSLFRAQRDFYMDYIEENTVKDKIFYVTVKVNKYEYDDPDQELQIRVDEIRSMLGDCGVKTERLNTNELYSLMASYFQEAVAVDTDYEFPVTLLKKDDLEKYQLNTEDQ